MTLIMPTTSSRNRQATAPDPLASTGGKVKKKKKRSGTKKTNKEKELASSLMVACLKRLLPVGLNLFAGREQEIVQHCKEKHLAKVAENEILDFVRTQLTLPDKYDPSDAMNWQHTLYSRLGGGRTPREDEEDKKLVPTVDDTVERIVAMAKVLYGLHIIDHPQTSKEVWRSVVSIQRKRAVIACFRQTSLHMMPRYLGIRGQQKIQDPAAPDTNSIYVVEPELSLLACPPTHPAPLLQALHTPQPQTSSTSFCASFATSYEACG
ncbi:Ryanodine receptor [Portunus trituberculatus]|uniref:Ryanodine receptor n=1 Tax=Portunus trituberculatus TaxID=210409 RepID=A0A5B7CQV7_PORTR|nr:Ryanodine receptor [Portunus trituberculatus]